ncbi:hypothetical protein Aspvir_009413 [Aspergillus viridinutans]|uniref:Uncharacterized protein n=1 Tax=Aspergillus viridinutans TaxID=75553 RepID=A0A9P3F4J0_ASPVI|nr:uncharacterized protein Aspvir_009413 [Aspergillus viridinutans]GIK05307.1 hypothetical protein Aspvir_009413 [Aspergillus viridinutans]
MCRGHYVARIIADPRTLNKKVHIYNEVYARNQVYDLLERLSGEKLERRYISEEDAYARVRGSCCSQERPDRWKCISRTHDFSAVLLLGIRGDNTPEYAEYLGYLSGKDVYPDFKFTKLEEFIQEVLEGKAKGIYQSGSQ